MKDYKALKVLEFPKIIGLLKQKAISQMGKSLAENLLPFPNLTDIKSAQLETSEAVSLILKFGSLPLGGISDIGESVKRAEMGGMLGIAELLHVGDFLYVCKKVLNYAGNDSKRERTQIIDDLFDIVVTVPELEKEIQRCIINDQEISDDASPKLRDIRRNIKVSEGRISEALHSVVHSGQYKNMLSDTVVTMRGGRFCVPVRSEYKNSFPGVIHDQSSSGQTVFMEPLGVVNLNNKIRDLKADEQEEIERILRVLSAIVGDFSPKLMANMNVLSRLDLIFAKGELSLTMGGSEPSFNTNGYVEIRGGRHPLLNAENVVPIDIYLGKEFTSLLITGPNTGGKTVSLKTVGLFTLMGQAGLHIPAKEHSQLAVFDRVFADIGDEQSIEQSLSTFSSHMTNIVNILGQVTENSLVLLDELGAGTDPTEGAALAIAIIRYLFDRGVRSVVTTHYAELKLFALSTEGIENAACEFDISTLKPTYRLLIGIPGKSNAFAISRRLGLPEFIIDSAREILSHEDERFEDIITDLEISKKSVIIEQERAEAFRREAEKLKAEYEAQKEKLAQSKEKVMREARLEAQTMLQKAKDEADEIIRQMTRIMNEKGSQKELETQRAKIRENLSQATEAVNQAAKPKRQHKSVNRPLAIGDSVYLHAFDSVGQVLSLPDSSGKLMVQSGIMKVTVNVKDVSLADAAEFAEPEKSHTRQRQVSMGSKAKNVRSELDLRGMMVSEAIEATDKYLDDAYLAGLSQVGIIHGKGTGALRSAITDHLKHHPHVKSHRLGNFGEGENGITIAELKL